MRIFAGDTEGRRSSLVMVFALAVLVFSVTRGLVPTLTGYASLAKPTYYTATLLGAALACYGVYVALFAGAQAIGKWPRRLLVLNLVLHAVWLAPVVIYRSELGYIIQEGIIPVIFTGLLPFCIYALIKIPERVVIPTLGFLTLVVAVSVIADFILINTLFVPDGFNLAVHWQKLLRPGVFESYGSTGAYGQTGMLYRPNGLFGFRPHDSGNILAILSVYWFAMFFRVERNELLVAVVTVTALIALVLTQSASNIIAGLVGVVFVMAVVLKNTTLRDSAPRLSVFLAILAVLLLLLYIYGVRPGAVLHWVRRVSIQYGDWQNMTNLGMGNWGNDLLALLVGHGETLGLSRIVSVSEIGFVKGLAEFGVFNYFVFLSMLFYPAAIFLFGKFRGRELLVLPYVAAVMVGVLSLWHYGSVMRATNIFVFFALYSQALRIHQSPPARPTTGQAA